ncbi:hypothetical protein CLCAR_3376 [Clostridium carboxidivorans P7]|nr:hypothetical protein CLCAR_3376 [Clostridium carboxidivorans P7]
MRIIDSMPVLVYKFDLSYFGKMFKYISRYNYFDLKKKLILI